MFFYPCGFLGFRCCVHFSPMGGVTPDRAGFPARWETCILYVFWYQPPQFQHYGEPTPFWRRSVIGARRVDDVAHMRGTSASLGAAGRGCACSSALTFHVTWLRQRWRRFPGEHSVFWNAEVVTEKPWQAAPWAPVLWSTQGRSF